jgi:hypothetical protein
MIQGPVLPLSRTGLWRLVRERPELLERGLRLCVEDLELGTAGLGVVDGLLRDAGGAPVLVLATDDRDGTLVARVLAAHEFWHRNLGSMARALPEANLRDSAPCRLLVLGSGIAPSTLAALERQRLDGLEIVEIEAFHVGEQERLCVRRHRPTGGCPPFDAGIDDTARALLTALAELLPRLDPRIQVAGDRFARWASHEGRQLCEFWFADQRVHAALSGEPPRELRSSADVRTFVDQVARRHLATIAVAGGAPRAAASEPGAEPPPAGRGARGIESLRASLAHARLTREEWTALGEVPAGEDPTTGG